MPSTESRLRRILVLSAFLLAATGLSVLVQGYFFAYSNQAYQLPLVFGMAVDPNFASDPLVQSLRHYDSIFLLALQHVVRIVPAAPAYFVVFLLVRLGLLASLHRLATVTFRDVWVSRGIVVLAVAKLDALVGAEQVSWNHLTHTAAAYPVLILSLAWLVEGRLIFSACAMAVAFYINPLTAVYTGLAYGMAIFARGPRDGLRWGAVVALLCAPFLAFSTSLAGPIGPDWVAVAKTLVGVHLVPSQFGLGEWAKTLGFVALALVLAREGDSTTTDPRTRLLKWLVVAPLLLTAAAWLCTEVLPIPTAMRLHLPRAFGTASVVAHLYLARFLFRDLPARRAIPWTLLLIAACFANRTTTPLFFAWLPWLWLRFFPGSLRERVGESVWRISVAAAALLAGVALSWYAGTGASSAFRVVALVQLALTPLAWLCSSQPKADGSSPAFGRHATAGAGVLVGVMLAVATAQTLSAWRTSGLIEPRSAWADVQRWARQSTPAGSLFLTPPDQIGFRSLSRRSSFVDWKDGCALLWEPAIVGEWLRRIQAIGASRSAAVGGDLGALQRELVRADRALDAAALRRLAADEGVAYAVRRKRGGANLEPAGIVVYENDEFLVVDLRPR